MQKKLTGWHVAAIFGGAFSIIIAVNLTLAYNAVNTFPGLEVKNSYVASQNFDDNRDAQLALGWSVLAEARDGQILLSVTDAEGAPVEVASHDDSTPAFAFDGKRYVAPVDLGPGNWNIRMVAEADDGTVFRQRVILHVPKERS